MQRLEVSAAVGPIYGSLGVKGVAWFGIKCFTSSVTRVLLFAINYFDADKIFNLISFLTLLQSNFSNKRSCFVIGLYNIIINTLQSGMNSVPLIKYVTLIILLKITASKPVSVFWASPRHLNLPTFFLVLVYSLYGKGKGHPATGWRGRRGSG
jgi:hypothetical protein